MINAMAHEFRHVFARAALVLAYIADFFIARRSHGFHGRLHRKECSQRYPRETRSKAVLLSKISRRPTRV